MGANRHQTRRVGVISWAETSGSGCVSPAFRGHIASFTFGPASQYENMGWGERGAARIPIPQHRRELKDPHIHHIQDSHSLGLTAVSGQSTHTLLTASISTKYTMLVRNTATQRRPSLANTLIALNWPWFLSL